MGDLFLTIYLVFKFLKIYSNTFKNIVFCISDENSNMAYVTCLQLFNWLKKLNTVWWRISKSMKNLKNSNQRVEKAFVSHLYFAMKTKELVRVSQCHIF